MSRQVALEASESIGTRLAGRAFCLWFQVTARGTADSQGPGDTRNATGRKSTPGGRNPAHSETM